MKKKYPVINSNISKRREENLSFIMIQISVCFVIFMFVLLVKIMSQESFSKLKGYYESKLNEPISFNFDFKDNLNVISRISNKENFEFANRTCGITAPYIDLSMPFENPIKNGELSSNFGLRDDPITQKKSYHKGIDIAAKEGDSIFSVMPGRVLKSLEDNDYGKYIVIDHGNGIQTLYAHCKSLLKRENDEVIGGEKIATVGSSGRSIGNHLHFELSVNGIFYNPNAILKLSENGV